MIVRPDSLNVYALDANDQTVIIRGCGSQPVVGYTYCRMMEGAPTTDKITLIAPPSECAAEDSCASFLVFFPDGSPSAGFKVPKGHTSVSVAWSEFVKGGATFEKEHRGFWPVLMTWKWIGPDKKEHTSRAEGEIRMRVLAKSYVPLHEIHEEANFVWKWADGPYQFRMTTTGRASAWRQ